MSFAWSCQAKRTKTTTTLLGEMERVSSGLLGRAVLSVFNCYPPPPEMLEMISACVKLERLYFTKRPLPLLAFVFLLPPLGRVNLFSLAAKTHKCNPRALPTETDIPSVVNQVSRSNVLVNPVTKMIFNAPMNKQCTQAPFSRRSTCNRLVCAALDLWFL